MKKAKRIFQGVWCVIKKVTWILFVEVMGRIASLLVLVVPFLHKTELPRNLLCRIWACSLIVFVIQSVAIWIERRKCKKEKKSVDILSRGFSGIILILCVSMFVANYYDTSFTWQWALTISFMAALPLTFYNLRDFAALEGKYTEEQNKRSKSNARKYCIIYAALVIFAFSVYTKWLALQFVAGGLCMVFTFTNLVNIVLNRPITEKFWFVGDLIIGVGFSIYLIYIIPIPSLKSTVEIIIGALYGGLMTLVGVAWTIRDGQRKEAESKRLEKIPYMQACLGKWRTQDRQGLPHPDIYIDTASSENGVPAGFSIELTNVGLGLADNLKCKWEYGEKTGLCNIPQAILQCDHSVTLDAIVSLGNNNPSESKKVVLNFEFNDLLGNHYRQDLTILFTVGRGYANPASSKMNAPIYVGQQENTNV